MNEELEYEYYLFLQDMNLGETFCRYFDETDYEDDYSHNEIDEWSNKLKNKIKEWLHNQYIVSSSWCIFVMTIDEAKKRNIHNWEMLIVK